ncbi:hypothetical protein BDW59DRAFT_150618 [Aspergillus cavernicola]|uniref:C2H2-type domain-containing protein n=1 Tax=Aspergillus cavernicola TaxID=176166 RepID=A0ABR4HZB0_9EURO
MDRPSSRNDFDIAIICALPLEANAVICSLDEHWCDAHHDYGRLGGDNNNYAYGRSGRHAVVVVTTHQMGKVGAASAAVSLKICFPCINLALLVGICGAVPYRRDGKEIILGDVIISEVLVELDFGRQYPDGFRRKDTIHDSPGRPNEEILGLLQRFKTAVFSNELHKRMAQHLDILLQHADIEASYPAASQDQLFGSDYVHKHYSGCPECSTIGSAESCCEAASAASCDQLGCDTSQLVSRSRLSTNEANNATPTHDIHFGSIGTADTVMKSAKHRDDLAKSANVIAFEMEGAGVWGKFSCLIIKGVCDYADSHKNKKWQEYAAAVAASVAMAVLGHYVSHDRPSQRDVPDSRSELNSQVSNSSRGRSGPQPFHIADDSLPKDIFNRVFNEFERRFDPDQVESFRATDYAVLTRELKRIQVEQERAGTLRNLRRIEHFIKKSQQFGQVLEGILGTAERMNFIWGPVKTLLQISRGHSDLLDAILSAYERLGDELPILSDHLEIFTYNVGLQRVLARLFEDIMEFHENAMRLYSGRALNVIFKPLWKDFKPRFENILLRIRSHRRLLEDKAQAINNHQGQDDVVNMQEIRDHLRQTEKDILDLGEQEAESQKKKLDEVREWIAGAETETKHNSICRDRARYPSSGEWILDNAKVQDWLSPESEELSSSILWINGRPGLGKTYLASVLIEACKKAPSWSTCYFYCKEKMEMSTSALGVLCGILLQLVCQHSDLVSYCHSKRIISVSPRLTDLSTANTLIETFCERIPRLYMIIDGLDECEEGRKELLETFKNLINKSGVHSTGKVRILVLSQPVAEFKNAVPEASILALGPEHNKTDIESYCQHRSREFRKFNLPNGTIPDALERICIRADGMFLFAKLVITNLARQTTDGGFKEEISTARLPNELNQAYDRIMDRLKRELTTEQLEYTRLLLGWLVCSKRPLKWTEIQFALSIDMKTMDHSNRINKDLILRDEVEELCGSLVQVLKGNRVELVHSTARLFIDQQSDINLAAAECDLTLRCLRYLTLDIFKGDPSDDDLRKYALKGHLAFQDYAAAAWYMHIKALVESKQRFLDGGVMLDVSTSPSTQMDKVSQELEDFVLAYEEEFPEDTVLEQSRNDCEFFQQYPFYDDLVRIWDHICSTQRGNMETKNAVSIGSLKTAFERNRGLLESLSEDPSVDFSSLYGKYPFRCPKITCFFFHEGFKSAAIRKDHVAYHDRPIRCPVEGCSRYTFGFRSNNELTYHVKQFHPEEHDFGDSFADLSRRQVDKTRWQCSEPGCGKFFSRNNILKDHERSHRGERLFCCSECGKGFVRKSDMRRHERIHDRRM